MMRRLLQVLERIAAAVEEANTQLAALEAGVHAVVEAVTDAGSEVTSAVEEGTERLDVAVEEAAIRLGATEGQGGGAR